ncbi:hypothetical protein ACIBCE_51025, partial [Streptomyces sp. NPDC051554]
QVIKLEQDRLVYQARLHSRFGRAWRRKAPVESIMPLRLARYGVPLAQTAPSGLAAAGIEPVLLPPAPELEPAREPEQSAAPAVQNAPAPVREQLPAAEANNEPPEQPEDYAQAQSQWLQARDPQTVAYQGGYDPTYDPDSAYRQWYAEQQQAAQFQQYEEEQQRYERQQQPFPRQQAFQQEEEPAPAPEPSMEDTGTFPIPSGPGRTREMGAGGGTELTEDEYYQVFKKSIDGSYPTSGQFRGDVEATYGITLPQREAERMVTRFTNRHTTQLEEEHIA